MGRTMDQNKLINEYILWLNSDDKSINTINTYVRHIKQFLGWAGKNYLNFEPGYITVKELKSYQKYMQEESKYKPKGIHQRMYSIFSYCTFLNEKGYIKTNPSKNIKLMKIEKEYRSPKIVEKHIMNAFVREVYKKDNPRDIAIIEMILGTGIRASECIALELDDIEISERKGIVRIREGKGSVYRELPLNKDIRKAISDYLFVRLEMYGKELTEEDKNKLWLGQRGHLTQDALNKIIKKYAVKIGYKDEFHPHMLRHYVAARLIRDKKLDLPTVARILGHSDINTTLIYTQPSMSDIEDALEGLSS